MLIKNENLIDLPVETKNGEPLGRISSFEIDIDSQSILNYRIKPSGLIKELLKEELIINRGQVLSISKEKMVVEDNVAREKVLVKKELFKKRVSPSIPTIRAEK